MVRGKDLDDVFEFQEITSGSGLRSKTRNREATDQQLKIWKDGEEGEYSIRLYANAARVPRDWAFQLK